MTAKQAKRTRNLRMLKQEIIDRMVDDEGYAWCQECKKTFTENYANEGLELHHKVLRSREPNHEIADAPENLKLLCVSNPDRKGCHEKAHGR